MGFSSVNDMPMEMETQVPMWRENERLAPSFKRTLVPINYNLWVYERRIGQSK